MRKNTIDRFRGGYQLPIFSDDEFASINTVSRADAMAKLQHIFPQIKLAMDQAYEEVIAIRNNNPCGFELYGRLMADMVYACFCANLRNIKDLLVEKGRGNTVCIEVRGEGIRLWLRKFSDGKHLLRPNSRQTLLKLNGKTEDDDIRPIVILGYTADKNNTGYIELCFTQQLGEHLEWEINIPEELRKQEHYLNISSITSQMNVDDSDDITMTVKPDAKLKLPVG